MVMESATDYLLRRSAELEIDLRVNCVDEACRVGALLHQGGARPWIGRIRDRRLVDDQLFSGLLYPARFAGRGAIGWTTHYVCCAGDLAFDPIAGEPVAVTSVADRLFGVSLDVEPFLSSEDVDDLLRAGSLRDELLARARALSQAFPLS